MSRALVNKEQQFLNPSSYEELLTVIVSNNHQDVVANLSKVTNKDYRGYSVNDIVKELLKLYSNGYSISKIVNVKVNNLPDIFPSYYEKYKDAKIDLSGLNFGQVALGLLSGIVGGSILGNVLFGTDPQPPQATPPPPPPTIENKTPFLKTTTGKVVVIAGSALVVITILYFIFRKK